MELDEMKHQWAEYDRKLGMNLQLNRQLLRAAYIDRARSSLYRLAEGLTVEAIMTFVAIDALGPFLYHHRSMVRFAFPAAVLDLFAIVLFSALIRQIVAVRQIAYDKPIAALQKELETLRVQRIRTTRGILLAAPLVWTPLLIVWLKGGFGIDAYRLFSAAYLWANLLFGLAFIPLAIGLSKRYADRMDRYPLLQQWMKDLAGHHLNAAASNLSAVAAFEEEGESSD